MINDYLKDVSFLNKLDNIKHKETYAKLMRLDNNNNPIESIEGRITQGSINVDGSSAVRRTCSLTLIDDSVDFEEYNWALKSKFKCEIGVKNTIDEQYPDIVWFPMGVYVVSTFNETINTSSHIITISGKDKMSMLNGELGGKITDISVDFGSIDEEAKDGTITNTDRPIREIITDMLHDYGLESYDNIIINDLDEAALELLEYKGDDPMYAFINNDSKEVVQMSINGNLKFQDANTHIWYKLSNNWTVEDTESPQGILIYDPCFSLDDIITDPTQVLLKNNIYTIAKIENGETAGYRQTDLTYAGDLIASLGDSITSVLDKIVKMLGNYEYFYNLDGQFIFQKKKTYVSASFGTSYEKALQVGEHINELSYSFVNNELVLSIQNTPNITNLANDYSIWGKKTLSSGSEVNVHVRYALDDKPNYYKNYAGQIYCTPAYVSTIKDKLRIDLTKEYNEKLTKFQLSYPVIGNALPAPQKLDNNEWSNGWWDIRDWYEWYKLITNGEEPPGTMKWYSYGTNSGCVKVNTITDSIQQAGYKCSISSSYYVWLLCFYNNTFYGQHGSSSSISGGRNCTYCESYLIDNIPDKYKNRTPYSVGGKLIIENPTQALIEQYHNKYYYIYYRTSSTSYWRSISKTGTIVWNENYEYAIPTYYTYTAFDDDGNNIVKYFNYPYAGCSDDHTYLAFLEDDIKQDNERIYFYHPQFPSGQSTSEIIEETIEKIIATTVHEVDWREIIYQMSLDYYKHHTEDKFTITVGKNNGYNEQGYYLYPNGRTGYENYYTDINSFWRDLYCPSDDYFQTTISESTYNNNLKQTAGPLKLYGKNYYYLKNEDETYSLTDEDFNINHTYYYHTYKYDKIELTKDTWKKNTYYIKKAELYIIDGNSAFSEDIDYYQRSDDYISVVLNSDYMWEANTYYYLQNEEYVLDTKDKVSYINYYICSNNIYYTRTYNDDTCQYTYNLAMGPYDASVHYYELASSSGIYENTGWAKDIDDEPESLIFWFDFMDTNNDAEISNYSVKKIGDRPKTTNDDSIKAIYFRDTPNVIFYNPKDSTAKYAIDNRQSGYTYIQYQEYMDALFNMSSQGTSAKETLDNQLYNYTYCAETVQISAVPIYYLEPNTKIAIQDKDTGINAQYIITKFSIPLGYNGNMSLTATKVPDKLY